MDPPAPSAPAPQRSLLVAALVALRPHQWIKNILLFGGLAFTRRWHEATAGLSPTRAPWLDALLVATLAFAVFCALSSAGYLINDLRDREADRRHPTKCRRPIAAGELPPGVAVALAVLLFAGALVGGWVLSRRGGDTVYFGYTALGYLLLTNAYSLLLKHYVIIDVIAIALMFVTRVVAGCWVIPEPPSWWIVICTLFGALYMALLKRRGELMAMQASGGTRPVLVKYQSLEGESTGLLDQMISMAGTAAILCYSLYTFYRPVEINAPDQRGKLMFTIPFVVYGVFRYLYLVRKMDIGQNPERLFIDRGMIVNLLLWGLTIMWATSGM